MTATSSCFPRIHSLHFKRNLLLILLSLSLSFLSTKAHSGEVTLAWDANTEEDLGGYKLHYGIASGIYNNSIDVGNVTEYTITGLDEFTTYYYAATAYDTDGNESDYSDELVHAISGNTSPIAKAGDDKTAQINDIIQLDGSDSSDADGDPLTYSWSFASAPSNSNAQLINPNTVNPSFTINVSGEYIVELVVNDGISDSPPDTVTISTQNSAPVANAGVDQSAQVNSVVQLNGSNSSDVDGNSLSFSWSFFSIPNDSHAELSSNTAVSPEFVIDTAGTYVVKLIVNDGNVDSQPDTVTITTKNSKPVADAGADKAAKTNDVVQLDGSGSGDVDGDLLSYRWSLISSPYGSSAEVINSHTANPSLILDVYGTYVVQLIVNDGLIDSEPDTIVISTENTQPVAKAGQDQYVGLTDTVQLSGDESYDADGDLLSYEWSFISKPDYSSANLSSNSHINPIFVPDIAGTYIIQLIVNDGIISSSPDMISVSVMSSGENIPPVANAGLDQLVAANSTIQLMGSSSYDADGDSLNYRWSVTFRPNGSKARLSNARIMNPTMSVDIPGTYIIQLIVDDGTIKSSPDTVTIMADTIYEVINLPEPPILTLPEFGKDNVSLTPILETDAFYDHDQDDFHAKTQWQIVRLSDDSYVLDVTSSLNLTSLKIPKLVLEENTSYAWRARFVNDRNEVSRWSAESVFTTGFSGSDADGNGIPDSQDIQTSLDLDQNDIDDQTQSDMKCIVINEDDKQIGVSIRDDNGIQSITALQAEDPEDVASIIDALEESISLPFGLIHFKLVIDNPGDEVVVTIYLSEAADENGIWYKYDEVNDELIDYSDYAEFDDDRKTVHLALKDGGFGDSDGIENGIIIDPLGFGVSDSQSDDSATSSSEESDDGSGGGGCFIHSAIQPSAGVNHQDEALGGKHHGFAIICIPCIILAIIGSGLIKLNKKLIRGVANR